MPPYDDPVLEAVAAAIQAALPDRIDGTDLTGTVRVSIGRDAVPVEIHVGPDWRRSVGSEAFGDAVGVAWQGAVSTLLDRLGERGVVAEIERLWSEQAAAPIWAGDGLASTHETVRAADKAIASMEAGLASGSGTAGLGRLVLTIDPIAGVSCTADPEWVSRQETDTLTEALNRALAAARAELSGAARST